MRINGGWQADEDGILRPVIRGAILTSDGTPLEVLFLVDTAADRTALSGTVLNRSGLPPIAAPHQLIGVGGAADSVLVQTEIVLPCDDGGRAGIRSHFAAFTDIDALDMSVLGRDILNLFALVVDRPGDIVCLLGPPHQYMIQVV